MEKNPVNIFEGPRGERLRQMVFLEARRRAKAEGKIEGLREALLAILEARSFSVTARQRAHIFACKDDDVLVGWITKAVPVMSTRELLREAEAADAPRTGSRVPPKRVTKRRAAAEK